MREKKDFNCDVYRHPVRQGLPIVGHRIEHDLYSLGVVMLDIGLWAPVESLFPETVEASAMPLPTDVQTRILKNVPRLYFYMGTRYAEAVRKCIEADWEKGKSGLEVAEEFKINVLDRIYSGHSL